MLSTRFIRIVAIVLGLTWLPITAFAQMCATHSIAMSVGGPQHPAMPHTIEEAHAANFDSLAPIAKAIVVDAETFWHSVDSFDDGCQSQMAMCALVAVAILTSSNATFTIDSMQTMVALPSNFPRSIEHAPESPPPRTLW